MRQVGLLPSGCQVSSQNSVLFFDEERLIYASSLAVYILNPESFVIEKILSSNQKSITSLSVSPVNKNLLAVGSIDGSSTIWSISEEEIISQNTFGTSVMLAWDSFSTDYCAVISKEAAKISIWDIHKAEGAISEVLNVKGDAKPRVARWNMNTKGLMAIGCNGGMTMLYRKANNSQKSLFCNDTKANVVDLQWDRLSSSYLLIAYNSHIELWDSDTAEVIVAFEKQPIPIVGIAWMDWTAGNFASVNARNCNIKIWNASQKAPLDAIKIPSDSGISALTFCAGKKKALFSCNNGSISVYDMQNSKVEYKSPPGHTETIFCCKYSPVSPDTFATGSYDSTVKIWSLPDFTLQKTLYGSEKDIVFCLSWSPDATMIAASFSSGLILIWNVESGLELARYLNHKKSSYFVSWNTIDSRYLLSTSADFVAMVFEVDIDKLADPSQCQILTGSRKKGYEGRRENLSHANQRYAYTHACAVYGCAWSNSYASVFTTCTQDGLVRVFNFNSKNPLIYLLKGHSARVFNCEWSPLLDSYLATTSDDRSILVWDIVLDSDSINSASTKNINPIKRLVGHTNYVRALSWNYEHKNILISGSWDHTIKVWDVAKGICIHTRYEHVADVYSIVSHPMRPFTYLSCSRDTTVRLWELESSAALLRYYSVWDGCLGRIIGKGDSKSIAQVQMTRITRSIDIKEDEESNAINRILANLPLSINGKQSDDLNQVLLQSSSLRDKDLSRPRICYDNLPSDTLALAEIYYKIFSFFNGSAGYMDLWEIVLTILSNAKGDGSSSSFQSISTGGLLLRPNSLRQIAHENEVVGMAKVDLRRQSFTRTSSRKTEMLAKSEDALMATALAHARLGDFEMYCSIMIDLGKWDAALAMAPSVSMEFWKELTYRYAQHLVGQCSELCVPYFVGIGKDAEAVDFYLDRYDTNHAFVLAKMSELRTDVLPDMNGIPSSLTSFLVSEQKAESVKESASRSLPTKTSNNSLSMANIDIDLDPNEASPPRNSQRRTTRERTEQEVEASRHLIKVVASQASQRYSINAQPTLAASQLLSVEDISGAIDILVESYEFDSAYGIARCFGVDATHILIAWADRCATWGALDLGLEMLSTLPNAEMEIALLLSKHCNEEDSRRILSDYGFQSLDAFLSKALEEEVIGSDADAVVSFVMARDYDRAIKAALESMDSFCQEPIDLTVNQRKLIRAVKYAKVYEVKEELRIRFLCFMLWFGAHDAAVKGAMDIASSMLNILLDYSAKVSFPVKDNQIQYQMMVFMLYAGDASGQRQLMTYIASEAGSSPVAAKERLRALHGLLKDDRAWKLWVAQLNGRGVTKAQKSSEPSSPARADGQSFALAVVTEIQNLVRALSLPSIEKALNKKSGRATSSGVDAVLSLIQRTPSLLLGSLLPVANMNLKRRLSTTNFKRIQGSYFELEDTSSYLSTNEAANWKRVNPFSPLMSGQFLDF